MNTLIRADFDFKSEKDKIKQCKGYVVCYDVVQTEYGCTFKVDRIIIEKLIATSPDFEKIEQLAIQNCNVLYDDNEVEEVINVGSLAEHREKRKVEACKICDNNCGYCKFNCNCSTEIEID